MLIFNFQRLILKTFSKIYCFFVSNEKFKVAINLATIQIKIN